MSSAQKRGNFRKSARHPKTNPNRERVPKGMRLISSKSAAPNFRAGSRELARLLVVTSARSGVSILRIVTGVLLLLELFALCGWLYFSRRSATGLPAGLLVYDDAGRQHLQRPLVSHRLCLAGRPDYLVETAEGLVPVELKSGACPRSGPHAAHVAQLMTYCVLVEDALARPVPYGLLQYSDAQRQIPFTADRKREVLQSGGRDSAQAPLCQRAQAASTDRSLSEMRLPVCVRRDLELIASSSRSGFCAHCRLEREDLFSVHQFWTAHRGRNNFGIR